MNFEAKCERGKKKRIERQNKRKKETKLFFPPG